MTRFPWLSLLLLAPLLLGPLRPAAAAPPTVAVRTVAAKRGALPDIVEGFGTAIPAPDGQTSLARALSWRVVSVAISPGQAVAADAPLLRLARTPATALAWHQAVQADHLARTLRADAAKLLAAHLGTRDALARAEAARQNAAAQLANLRAQQADQPALVLRAPHAALVLSVPAQPGAVMAPGAPLVVLARPDRLVLRAGISPTRRHLLRPGQEARLLPLDGGNPVAAHILTIGAALDPASGMIPVILKPATPLLSGAAYRAEITAGRIAGWVVPHESVLRDGAQAYLFQIRAGHAVRVAVRILGGRGPRDVVAGALDPALGVVTAGAAQLHQGMATRTDPVPAP